MQLRDRYQKTKTFLKNASVEQPDLEARWILKKVLKIADADIIAGASRPVTDAENAALESMIARRTAGEPLSRIFGEREFYGRNFKISPDTLDPRPDTEILIDAVLRGFHVKQGRKPLRILDLGTGTGAILISLLAELPESEGVGVDISQGALRAARENARSLGVEKRCRWICGDWGDSVKEGQFDLVVSNPPYIESGIIPNLAPEVRNHDPILALDGGPDGLSAYEKIFLCLPKLLNKDGRAFLEIGFDQKEKIERLAKKYRIRVEAVHPDLAGNPRVVEISRGDK